MLKRSLIHCGLAAMLLVTSSCLFDPEEAPPQKEKPRTVVQLKDLTQRENVLNNIEYAYDNRRTDVYDQLLDQQFTFFFSPGDVGGGLPEQWGRSDELTTVNYLFISNTQPVPAGPVCKSTSMDLNLENITWLEIIPEDYPTEVWSQATINYEFLFKMEGDLDYQSSIGAKAQFTVRNVGTDAAPHWQLVEFRELEN